MQVNISVKQGRITVETVNGSVLPALSCDVRLRPDEPPTAHIVLVGGELSLARVDADTLVLLDGKYYKLMEIDK